VNERAHVEPSTRWRTLRTLTGPWPVSFQSGRGAPVSATFPELTDFRDHTDPGVRYFSGIASYSKEFQLAAGDRAAGGRIWIDLGQVDDLAEVWVNGHLAGTAWKPPYRVDVSAHARSGRNQLEIRAVNLWVNRLIGDVQPGVTTKITFTQADGKVSSSVSSADAANQLRMPYGPDAPLRPSGLIGPVTVLEEEKP